MREFIKFIVGFLAGSGFVVWVFIIGHFIDWMIKKLKD